MFIWLSVCHISAWPRKRRKRKPKSWHLCDQQTKPMIATTDQQTLAPLWEEQHPCPSSLAPVGLNHWARRVTRRMRGGEEGTMIGATGRAQRMTRGISLGKGDPFRDLERVKEDHLVRCVTQDAATSWFRSHFLTLAF